MNRMFGVIVVAWLITSLFPLNSNLWARVEVMRTNESLVLKPLNPDKWQFPNDKAVYAVSGKEIYRGIDDKWTRMPITYATGDTDFEFHALWALAPDKMFAVGGTSKPDDIYTQLTPLKGVIYQFDGERWEPMLSGSFNPLYDIWGNAADNILAVGGNGTILRFDGRYWNAMDSGTNEHFSYVKTISRDDAFAVTNVGNIYHFDGMTWQRYHDGPPCVPDGPYESCYSSETASESVAWPIAGESKDDICLKWCRPEYGSCCCPDEYFHFDGVAWQPVAGCDALPELENVSDWIDRVRQLESNNFLYAIWGSGPDDVFSVGGRGRILHYDGSAWQEMQSPATQILRDIHGASGNHVMAVGDEGTVLLFDGQQWEALQSGVTENLNSVYVGSTDLAVLIGDNGTILQYENGRIRPADIGPDAPNYFYDVWGSSTDDIWVVTNDDNSLLHYDGASWNTVALNLPVYQPPINFHRRIWGTATDDMYLLSGRSSGGYSGFPSYYLHHFDGTQWRSVLPADAHLAQVRAIGGDLSGNLYISEERGYPPTNYFALMMYNSNTGLTTLTAIPTEYGSPLGDGPLGDEMKAIWAAADGTVYFAGENGAILKMERPDSHPPEIIAMDPAPDAVDVNAYYLRILFSESIAPETVNDQYFKITDESGNDIPQSVTSSGNEVFIDYDLPTAFNHTLTARVSAEVRDLAGNRLGQAREWSFKLRHATHIDNSDMYIGAELYTSDQGIIDGTWRLGGEDLTDRGDRVVWGYFHADPGRVAWGSSDNPDLFVKIWFDVTGHKYVSYLHQSVPQILVSTFCGNAVPTANVATLSRRYVGHYLNKDAGVFIKDLQSDSGDPAPGLSAAGNPSGYVIRNGLRIGAIINTVDKGPIQGLWEKGGEDTTPRGDQVVWGYFYADPKIMNWGSRENPDLFVKIWFDAYGAVIINYFHASAPDIEVYSDYPNDGRYDQAGATTNQDRYIRHSF